MSEAFASYHQWTLAVKFSLKAGLEQVAEVKATDLFKRVTAMGLQEFEHLLAKGDVANHETTHILIPLVLNDEKHTILRANVG